MSDAVSNCAHVKYALQRKLDIDLRCCHPVLVLLAYDSRLRDARLNAGLSQEALAREVGVSRQTIVNIERGESEPKVLLAIAIAVAVGLGAAAVSELFRKGGTHE